MLCVLVSIKSKTIEVSYIYKKLNYIYYAILIFYMEDTVLHGGAE